MGGETLGDYVEIVMGQSPEGITTNAAGDGMPLLNGPTEFGRHNPKPVQWTTDPKRVARKGDLLFCVRGSTTGRMNWADQEYAIGRGLAAIRPIAGDMSSALVRAVIEARLPGLLREATGSTFPNVSAAQLSRVSWPSLDPDRRRITGNVLSAIDELTEVAEEARDRVGELISATYRAELAKATVTAARLGDVATFVKGAGYKSSELLPSDTALVSLKAFRRTGGYQRSGLKPFVGPFKPTQVVGPQDSVLAQTDLTQGAEVIGRVIRVPADPAYSTLVASMDAVIVRPAREDLTPAFLYAVLSSDQFRQHCRAQANGTTVLHLPSNAPHTFVFDLPERGSLQRITARLQQLFDLHDAFSGQVHVLVALATRLTHHLIEDRSALADLRADHVRAAAPQ